MCELLGFSAARSSDITKQLREFYSHSSTNPHGWGIMYSGGTLRESLKASESDKLSKILDYIEPQRILLAHIRFATVGSIRQENCHPFTAADVTGRQWTMIHNGTIYSGSRLIPMLSRQKGDTDSERLFLYLLDKLNSAQAERPLHPSERFKLVEEIVFDIAPRNKLNLMIYDGELLYIHKNMEETMKFREIGSGVMFSTTALDDGDWQEVPMAQLLAYRDGEKVFEGTKHKGIFVPTLQYITAMDAMNI